MHASELGNHNRRSSTGAARRLAAAAAVLVLVLALALTLSASRDDEASVERPVAGLRLTYRVKPAGAAAAERTAQVLRERLAAAGVHADVSVSASAALTITATARAGADVTALVERGRVAIYDWERSVLGPRGAPAPRDADVTGGSDAGRAAALTRAEAEKRAAARPDGRVVSAESRPGGWFALGGRPAMTDVDIASAVPPAGVGDMAANQHFAIVNDDRIVAAPHIAFRAQPDGIDGSTGAMIEGGLTPDIARRTAAILNTGPLPAALSNPIGSPVTSRHP